MKQDTTYTNYTGHGSHFQDEAKKKLQELRIKYPKAKFKLVHKPDSGLSRGGSDAWYQIYGDAKYTAYKTFEWSCNVLECYDNKMETLRQEYDLKLSALKKEYEEAMKKKLDAIVAIHT